MKKEATSVKVAVQTQITPVPFKRRDGKYEHVKKNIKGVLGKMMVIRGNNKNHPSKLDMSL